MNAEERLTTGEQECPTCLVSDSPAEEDRFGPHREIANAVAELVRTEDGGRSIGLSGPWGAGKSTVVSLLRRDIAVSSEHCLWVFDAWAHEGDPLRRTFLESLIGFLRERRWIGDEAWSRRVESLTDRKSTRLNSSH